MTLDAASAVPRDSDSLPPASRRSIASRITDAILSVLALLGAVCIIAAIAAFACNISLIMFKTGSMSPTIPTGSLAVVKQIPASDIKVGDVTTVSRGEGQLPVTHRVVSVEPAGGDSYTIAMKGDANASPDSQPYVVTDVRKVLWHAPRLAYLVSKASQPRHMVAITIAAALLVTWAFWPRKQN